MMERYMPGTKMLKHSFLFLFFLLLFAGPACGDEIKDKVDQSLRWLRSMQNSDGSYGSDADKNIVTPLTVLAFGTSPRRYTDLDGPFIRNAVERIVSARFSGGSNGFQENKNLADPTALSIAAVASVNRFKHTEFLKTGCSLLSQDVPDKGSIFDAAGKHDVFHALLALKTSNSSLLKELAPISAPAFSLDDTDFILRAAWIVSAGRSLQQNFDTEGVIFGIEKMLSGMEPDESDENPKHVLKSLADSTKLWASVYLLAQMDATGQGPDDAPPLPTDWAERVAGPLMSRVDALLEHNNRCPKGEEKVHETALMTCVLSLCHGRGAFRQPLTGAQAQTEKTSPFVEEPRTADKAIEAALGFLSKNNLEGRFGFGAYADPGITALALSAAIRGSRALGKEEPGYVRKGLDYLLSLQKEDGSIYKHGLANYVTSASIMALADSGNQDYEPAINAGRDFLVVLQADEEEGYSIEEDPNYGGLGYGGDERPDLSNTQMSIEALKKAGLDQEHEAFKKAVLFLERCQNLSEVNPTRVQISPTKKIISGNDGGAIYAPGASKADLEEIEKGVFVARSYGSMTYALLKSYVFAGLDKKDKRVQAAVSWIKNNYTLDENPGFVKEDGSDTGQQGLYYYYLTMARAFEAIGLETIETADNVKHEWAEELQQQILALQRQDGSWLNQRSSRWFEGNPVLATSYALLVLDVCRR